MRSLLLVLAPLATLACNDKSADSGPGGTLTPQVSGTITVTGEDAEGRVELFHGFGFDQGGVVLLYLSSNPEADCALVTDLLGSHDGPFDMTGYVVGGTCDFFVRKDGYTGEMTFVDDAFGRAGWAINCFTGQGAFEFENRTNGGDDGFYWTGRKWLGYPTVYSYTIRGGDGSDYTIDLDLVEYNGGFPEEGLEAYPATGAVQGSVSVEWCSTLGRTPAFSGG